MDKTDQNPDHYPVNPNYQKELDERVVNERDHKSRYEYLSLRLNFEQKIVLMVGIQFFFIVSSISLI